MNPERWWNATCNPKVPLDLCISVVTDDGRPVPAMIVPDATLKNRMMVVLPNDPFPNGPFGATVTVMAPGYQACSTRWTLPAYGVENQEADTPLNLQASVPPFPPGTTRAPLPPFDPSDSEGDVHTTPPPEFQPPAGRDVLWMRADFNGHCIDMNRWGTPPLLVNANSTPINMLMTPMAPLYPVQFQEAMLTEHAEIGYTHFVSSPVPWNAVENGRGDWSPADAVAWARQVKAAGFFNVEWLGGWPSPADPFVMAVADAGLLDFLIVGGEVDDKGQPAEAYDAVLQWYLANLPGIPLAAHFTANYPTEFPRDTFITNWAQYNGRVHLCWQANCSDPNQKGYTPGGRGSMLYYARQRVNLGLQGGNGQPAPDSRIYAFEIMAFAQLQGQCTEDYGNLQSLELLYCPEGITTRGVDGFGNGARYPDGSVI